MAMGKRKRQRQQRLWWRRNSLEDCAACKRLRDKPDEWYRPHGEASQRSE